MKKETKLGLSAKKWDDFGSWYSEVVVEGELISYYDVSGPPQCSHPSSPPVLTATERLPCSAHHGIMVILQLYMRACIL